MIKLIINADDFGYSKVFNEKILELLEKEFIKSTTVLVNRITKDQEKQIKKLITLRKIKNISIGLHTDFDLEKPLEPQIENQYKKFILIFGFSPSHIDIHKFIEPRTIEIVNKFSEKHKLPVRNHGIRANTKQTDYKEFHSRDWGLKLNGVKSFLEKVKDESSCEIVTHPGDYDPNSISKLNKERRKEYENIIKFQEFLKSNRNIKLISYLEL